MTAANRLNFEFTSKLIALVRGHPVLYTRMTPGSVKVRERTWEQIANQLESTVSTVKTRWKHLRDAYRKSNKLPVPTRLKCYTNNHKGNTLERFREELGFLEFANDNKSKSIKKTLKSVQTDNLTVDEDIMEEDSSEDNNSQGEVALTVTDIEKYMQYRNVNIKNRPTLPVPETICSISDSGTSSNDELAKIQSFGCIRVKSELIDGDKDFDSTETEIMQVKPINTPQVNDIRYDLMQMPDLAQHEQVAPEIINVHSCAYQKNIGIDNDLTKRLTARNDQKNLVNMMKKVLKQNEILKRRLANIVKKKHTPTHSFFSSMADIVSNFPAEAVADVRMKICTIVTSAELNCMNMKR